MSSFLDRIFQLKSVSAGAEGVDLRWAHPLPLWAWAFIALFCFLLAAWSYWNLIGKTGVRAALALVRTLLLLIVAVLIAGPELVKQNDQVEQDWVIVMADRSASLTVADGPERSTREQQLAAAVRQGWPTFAQLAQQRNVLFLGFDSGAFDLRTIAEPDGSVTGIDLGQPAGRRTMLGHSLEQTLRRVAARPVAGVVVLSDGRSSDSVGRAALKQLEARQIPVFSVPLGSADPLTDMALARLDAPTAAFIGDYVPVSVDVERLGGNPDNPVSGTVQLVDNATDTVLDELPLDRAISQPQRVTLTARPEEAGEASWSVRLVLDTPDLTQENNRLPVRVELVDRPIRVVYFDGYPRWEYRYLKNLLLREQSIRSSTLLLAADRRYIQEGTDTLDALPRTQDGWNQFDVIIMGDLRPSLFSDEQLQQIRTLVSERGAGLVWMGGSASTPNAWRGTPLADLVPFSLTASEGAGTQTWLDPVVLQPGPAASRYGVLQLGESPREPWPDFLSSTDLGWNTFRWAQRIEPAALKPTTEVLALASPTTTTGGSSVSPSPLAMTMRYGAGRVVYVATDETWRYRYARGEVLTERFWIPVVRLLARGSLGRSGKPALIETSPERAQVNQQVQVSVRLLDQTFVDKRPESLKVRLTPQAQPGVAPRTQGAAELTLKPQPRPDDAGPSDLFTATWVPTEPGTYLVQPADQLLSGLDLSARLEVVLPDDELRVPQADHAALATLSQATGGRVLQAAQLSELPNLLPNRELHLLGTPDVETLWDKPIVWTVLILLLIFEWVGRRLIKLS